MPDQKFVLSENAARQFQRLLEAVGERFGWQRELATESQLYAAFDELGNHPGLGHTRADLVPGPTLFYLTTPYMLLYLRYPSVIRIVGVFHGAQDIAALHGNES